MISISLSGALLAGLFGALPADVPGVELRYHGSLAKASRDAETISEPVKRFDLYCLATPRADRGRDLAFIVDEHGGGTWPWPARFGTMAIDAENRPATNLLRLLYEHDASPYVLHLPVPIFEFSARLAADAQWEAPRTSDFANQQDKAPWKYRVAASAKVGSRDCWRVNVTNNFGPQETVWIEKDGLLLVKLERRVVIGRGEVHLLTMELDSVAAVDAGRLARLQRPLQHLLRLQQQLKRSDDDKSPELSPAQVKLASEAFKTLESEAEGTPFEPLVATIGRDVRTQSRRAGDVESLARRFLGKRAPAIALKSLDGETIDPAERAGKIVLLHFWSYQGEPFPPEPYGQVGYLDYLYHRRGKLGLQVYGVAVNRAHGDPAPAAAARSVRKLQSFMNLSYPLALDDGTLLDKFGAPERFGAKLPLWVLIDPAGNVVEYKVGHYDIKADEGLSQLDKSVLKLIRKGRKSAPSKSDKR